jgi:hypothetical protein
MRVDRGISFLDIIRLIIYIGLGLTSASVYSISLYCEPVGLGGWNTAMDSKGQVFPETCMDYRKLYPDNFGCYPFYFYYEPPSDFGRKVFGAKSTYKLIAKTAYEYEFQKEGVMGFNSGNDVALYSVSEEDKIKIDRSSLEYTYTHGSSMKIGPSAFNSTLMLESGVCAVVEAGLEEPLF